MKYETNNSIYEYDNGVLKNKFNIQDHKRLEELEQKMVPLKEKSIDFNDIKYNIDSINFLCSIHKFLFEDIYEGAGKLRTTDISKDKTKFANGQHIVSSWNDLIKTKINSLNSYPDKTIVLAEIFGDLNAIHPFREGNGRTIRVFLSYLAFKNKLIFDGSKLNKSENWCFSILCGKC